MKSDHGLTGLDSKGKETRKIWHILKLLLIAVSLRGNYFNTTTAKDDLRLSQAWTDEGNIIGIWQSKDVAREGLTTSYCL